MKNLLLKIRYSIANKTMVVLPIAITIFHVLILAGIVPADIVWGGGHIETQADLYRLEAVSISLNLMTVAAVLKHSKLVKLGKQSKGLDVFMTGLGVMFVFNGFANIFSETLFERLFFTPLILVYAAMTFRLVFEPTELKHFLVKFAWNWE